MSESFENAERLLRGLLSTRDERAWAGQLAPRMDPPVEKISAGLHQGESDVRSLLESVAASGTDRSHLADPHTVEHLGDYRNHIENMIGTVKVPVGVAGPLRLRGLHAQGDFKIPLATHEAALVASYHRGMQAINQVGGCTAVLLNNGVPRVPCFTFSTVREAASFLAWLIPREDEMRTVAEATTRHGKVTEFRLTVEGCHVYLHCLYQTGDAAGQNMVTVATQALCDHIAKTSPVPPKACYVESNLSGDKKASAISFGGVRGKKVTCEVLLSPEVLGKVLGVTAEQMEDYWRVSAIGGVLSGSMGIQGHYANGLAALFIACGQDAASRPIMTDTAPNPPTEAAARAPTRHGTVSTDDVGLISTRKRPCFGTITRNSLPTGSGMRENSNATSPSSGRGCSRWYTDVAESIPSSNPATAPPARRSMKGTGTAGAGDCSSAVSFRAS